MTERDAALDITALAIKVIVSNILSKLRHIDFEALMQKLTFATDRESSMPSVFGVSVSLNVDPLDLRWVDCIFRQMSTAVRTLSPS